MSSKSMGTWRFKGSTEFAGAKLRLRCGECSGTIENELAVDLVVNALRWFEYGRMHRAFTWQILWRA